MIQLAKDPANPLPIEAPKAGVATGWQVETPAPGPASGANAAGAVKSETRTLRLKGRG